MIIDRYITKEVALNFLAVTSILLFVALSNKFVSLLAKVAVGQLPSNLVFKIMGLYMPELLASLAPLGLFIAILFAYGRLHADSEMSVLFTCGVDWTHITKVALILASGLAFCDLMLTAWIIPNITKYREEVFAQGEAVGIMQAIVPGQFQMLDGGRLVFYVEDLERNNKGQLAKVFIAEQLQVNNTEQKISLITAANGYLEHKGGTEAQDFFLVLKDGRRYTGMPGTMDYTVVEFTEYGRGVENNTGESTINTEELMSTIELLHSNKLGDIAELQWRLSLPLSVLILGFLAVPLAKVRPRQGRFAKFLPAILLYIAYFNMIIVTKRWVGVGALSPYCGIWCVHIVFFLLACLLLAKASGRLTQWYQTYTNRKWK